MEHVFITGSGRSGTTMLGSILGACRESVATPESDFFMEFYYRCASGPIGREAYLRFLEENYRFRQWEVPIKDIDLDDADFEPLDLRKITEKTAAAYALKHTQLGDTRFSRVDHTPSNIRYFLKLNSIFPDARIIFMVRDPRAVYASVRNLDWGANTALKAGTVWIEYAAQYYAVQKLAPNRILLVRYEDLVADPANQVKRICEFSRLEYHPEILKGGGLKLPKYTVAQHAKVGKAPDPTNIDKWQKKLSDREVMILESVCGTVMASFGYDRVMPDSYRVGFRNELRSIFMESYFYVINKFRKNKREKIY